MSVKSHRSFITLFAVMLSVLSVSALTACERFFGDAVTLTVRLNPQQSKFFVPIYEGSPAPPSIDEKKLEAQIGNMVDPEQFPSVHQKLVSEFGDDKTLWYYFLSDHDTDGDGIPDWKYDADKHQFIAFDTDIDGDGVENILDADPFDKRIKNTDTDSDGIPDHLDYKPKANSPETELSEYQMLLFKKTGILAVNQDAHHDVKTLKAFTETTEIAYQQVIDENQHHFPALNFLLASHGMTKDGVLAFYQPALESITVLDLARSTETTKGFPASISSSFYTTLVHEMAHALQTGIKKKSGQDQVFEQFLSKYWIRGASVGDEDLYLGKPKSTWIDDVKAEIQQVKNLYHKTGKISALSYMARVENDKIYFEASKSHLFTRNGVPSLYSLSSPEEYFAEAVTAYVYKKMSEKIFEDRAERLREKGKAKFLELVDQSFYEKSNDIGIFNLRAEDEDYIDHLLELERSLHWDSHAKDENGKAGKWVSR